MTGRLSVALICALSVIAGCGTSARRFPETPAAPASPSAPPTAINLSFWVQPGVPLEIVSRISPILENAGYARSAEASGAAVQIVINPVIEPALSAQWVYALVTPFPTIADDVPLSGLMGYWQGVANPLPALALDAPLPMFLRPDVYNLFTTLWGPTAIAPTESAALIDLAWNSRPALSVIPFEQLEPRWKVLSIDSKSPLDKHLDMKTYPLAVRLGVIAIGDAGEAAVALLQSSGAWQAVNRDPSKMSVVILTGTTALTRSTAWFMENQGMDFPAQNILAFLADKDILHTSNEVSFTPQCPPPDPTYSEKFCSKPGYFELLQVIDVDIVELTGNHNNDYGLNADLFSLDLYDENQIAYYGGGRQMADAAAPRVLTVNGIRFAFVGCNSAGPYTAWATAESPGAAPCGDWTAIRQTISDLKSTDTADVVIVTLQYHESQSYYPEDQQIADMEALADAGADIVSGSQAHVPQGFSFAHGKFIHFGVGNLFFDQMDFIENRQMFIDKYIFYEDRLISTVLFTGLMESYSQPRPMTPEERAGFLRIIFEVSHWDVP